jgi:hypothetical protein
MQESVPEKAAFRGVGSNEKVNGIFERPSQIVAKTSSAFVPSHASHASVYPQKHDLWIESNTAIEFTVCKPEDYSQCPPLRARGRYL